MCAQLKNHLNQSRPTALLYIEQRGNRRLYNANEPTMVTYIDLTNDTDQVWMCSTEIKSQCDLHLPISNKPNFKIFLRLSFRVK